MKIVRVLVLALGGEGGGVLVEWLVKAAIAQAHPAQSTSIPGVAQRTGATSYYLEWLPAEAASLGGREPVFCLSPMPGDLDLVVSSELLETARAVERALPDPARTRVITSTRRFLTVAEKMQMGDGRVDAQRLREAVRAGSRDAVMFDMQAEAERAGTVVSAVMFGAVAASGVLPLPRTVCEQVIRAGGRGVDASLAGFAAGWAAVEAGLAGGNSAPVVPAPAPAAEADAHAVDAEVMGVVLPEPVVGIARLGAARLLEYQDAAWAREYLAHVRGFCDREAAASGLTAGGPSTDGAAAFAASAAAARWLALWMSYEDVIRVADLKSRRTRFARIRAEVGAAEGEPVVVRDFLKPGVDELAAILPPRLAAWLTRRAARSGRRALSDGLRLNTGGAIGLAAMRLLAALRPLRRRSSRFAAERALIARWAAALDAAFGRSLALAHEIAQAPRLIKGYGDTHARGRGAFERILEALVESPPMADADEQAAAIRRACAAAQADPAGRQLAAALGLPAPEPVAQPVRLVPRGAGRPS